MELSPKKIRESITMDSLLSSAKSEFLQIKDTRSSNVVYPLDGVLMSGLAIFSLKHPSIHHFEQQSKAEKKNLTNLFGIKKLCSDAQMRNILDEVPVSDIQNVFKPFTDLLSQSNLLSSYIWYDQSILVPIDGVEHFHSTTISCPCCLEKKRSDRVHYHHQMLSAVIVHPQKREVFPIASEPIVKQDGETKNDCELNAAVRLIAYLHENHPDKKFTIVEDALYSNAPHIRNLKEKGFHFIIGIKPDSHKTLFETLQGREKNGLVQQLQNKKNNCIQTFKWINGTALNASNPDVIVNVLHYEELDTKTGCKKIFTWVTDFKISKRNVDKIMQGGRARWKIENETFNTLKNQGYHFEHNYGHGQKNLSEVMAKLMLLAFLLDQIMQAVNEVFKRIWIELKTKKKLWEAVRAVFMVTICKNFKELYLKIAKLNNVLIE